MPPRKPTDHNQIYASLAALRAEEAELIPIVEAMPEIQKLKSVRAAITALESYAATSRQRTGSVIVSTQSGSEFANMSLPDASIRQLEIAGKPQTAKEIWDALSAGGLTVTAKHPVHAVHWSLRRRSKKNQRLNFAESQWSLKPVDLKKGGMTNRDRDEHIERTKEGIAHFKARTGSTWGRKPKITADQIEKFRELYDTGKYTVFAVSKEAGVSNAYFYMNREAILAWKKGDPWPLPRPKAPNPAVVDLFPVRAVGDEK
jgi:hypothetical protein